MRCWEAPHDRKARVLVPFTIVIFVASLLTARTAEAGTVFTDGFESGSAGSWSATRGSFTVQREDVATGAWAARATGNGTASNAWLSLPQTYPELSLAGSVKIRSRSTAVWLGSVRTAAGSPLVLVGVSGSGKVAIRNGVSGTQINSSTAFPDGWHRLEVRVVIGGPGRVEVSLDGTRVAGLSLDQPLGSAPIGRVMIGNSASGQTYDVVIDDVVVSTDGSGSDVTPPDVPRDLRAVAVDDERVQLSWSASTDDVGIAGYTVYRLDGSGSAAVGSTATTFFVEAGLAPGATYRYAVDAFDAAGNHSTLSDPVEVTTQTIAARPDIVLILTDDQPADTLDRMPSVQRELVDRGVTFENAIVTNSLCCPSRASILRGQYSQTTGIYDNAAPFGGYSSFRSFGLHRSTTGVWLRQTGYRTGYLGKVMNGYTAKDVMPGWDYWAGTTAGYHNYEININGIRSTRGSAPADYHTTVLAGLANSFIRGTPPGTPLFLQIAPYAPHAPFTPAPEHADDPRCVGATNVDAISFNEVDVSDKPAYVRAKGFANVQKIGHDRPVAQCRTLLSVDDLVADVVQALSETGRLGRTLIVFTSDNGLMNGEHRAPDKEWPYEGTLRVPMVMRYDPLTTASSRVERSLVANIDLAPTMVDLVGVSISPGCPDPPYGGVCSGTFDGISLLPLLMGSVDGRRPEGVLFEHKAKNAPTYCGIRTQTHKYLRLTTGEEELYDLQNDPGEMVNLLGDGSLTSAELALREEFRATLFGPGGWCLPPPPGYSLPA